MTDTDIDPEFAGIPNLPTRAQLEPEILASGHPLNWRPHRDENGLAGTPGYDINSLSDSLKEKVTNAKVRLGPGPNANAYQRVVHENLTRQISLNEEKGRLEAQLEQVLRYDEKTGEPQHALAGPARKQAQGRLVQIEASLEFLQGPEGRARIDNAIDDAVREAQRRFKQQYIEVEAKRRATSNAMEDEINRRAAVYKKGTINK